MSSNPKRARTSTSTPSSSSFSASKLENDVHTKSEVELNHKSKVGAQLANERPQIAILDFGSQTSHLIARRVREHHVFCELYSCETPIASLQAPHANVVGVILSGGPSSVYDEKAPHLRKEVWDWIEKHHIPVLGICYGMCEIATHFGGEVEPTGMREYGKAYLSKVGNHGMKKGDLFYGIQESSIPVEDGDIDKVVVEKANASSSSSSSTLSATTNQTSQATQNPQNSQHVVWMSHADKIKKLPSNFTTIAKTPNAPNAAIAGPEGAHLYGVQFHPEVMHSIHGSQILHNFVVDICGAPTNWNMRDIASEFIQTVHDTVGESGHVLGAVSGGVDSSVAAVLLNKAIGKRFHAIMVDNGCLRLGEGNIVVKRLKEAEGIDLHLVDASERFMAALKGVSDPEQKRKIIGGLFIEVFQEEAERIKKDVLGKNETLEYLLQGTLYPDVIESLSYKGPSATIKSHHNVGGLPDVMNLKLIEPLRELFKDEVRELGLALGLDPLSIWRHPFPGPGLAIRILGEVTMEVADRLRHADDIMIQEVRKAGVYDKISQAFVVFLPIKSVGVMGDGRTYENVVSLRFVTTTDFMTADWYRMDPEVISTISNRIINEVPGINRVVMDVSSKPPATIEWE